MTEICDCHGADKAYAIINPDSPDRKEILSLNPPICREILPEQNGIKVTWQDGSIDLLEGTNWEFKYLVEASVFHSQAMSSSFNASGCSGTCKVGEYRLRFWGDPFSPLAKIQGSSLNNSCGTHHKYTLSQDGQVIPSSAFTEELRLVPCDTRLQDPNGWRSFRFYDQNIYNVGDFSLSIYKVKVETNTGDSAERITARTPDVSFNGKDILTIFDQAGVLYEALEEGQEIKVNCADRQCPPETCCNPCEGKALNCCYDENGKLIDSFIRRT